MPVSPCSTPSRRPGSRQQARAQTRATSARWESFPWRPARNDTALSRQDIHGLDHRRMEARPPGDPIAPGCPAEELALELIRQQAILALELVDAPSASLSATKGVYEVCEDDDILDLFAMQEPADAALALTNPINVMMGKADMRVQESFHPFYDGGRGFAPHPIYNERAAKPAESAAPRKPIEVIAAEPSPHVQVQAAADDLRFRVCIRVWEDNFLDRPKTNWMPDRWVYYPEASNADQARAAALELFPHGASDQPPLSMTPRKFSSTKTISRGFRSTFNGCIYRRI